MRGWPRRCCRPERRPPELLVEGAGAHELAFRDWLDPPVDEAVAPRGSSLRSHGVLR
jgi:ribonuclease G